MRISSRGAWAVLALAAGAAWWAGCSSTATMTASTRTPPADAPKDTASPLDKAIASAWQSAGVTPSAAVDDATFLRRASLDLVGRIATSDEVRAFLADGASDKRRKAVDRLLASPEHAAHLARVWDGILMGAQTKANAVDRGAFLRWLELAFSEKEPWDKMVREIVAAKGKNSLGGKRSPESFEDGIERAKSERDQGVNGAVNFVLRRAPTPADLAGDVSRDFLGVQIQCAQCHDHKTEKWTQNDFRSFASALLAVKPERLDVVKGEIPVVDLEDSAKPPKRFAKNPDVKAMLEATPRALDGTELPRDGARDALAAWMTADKNPWFARAMVNRVWAQIFGSGFVDPPDDFREKSVPVMPEVLDRLAADFVASHYDLDALYREILSTDAYARSVGAGSARDALYSHGELEALSPDQLFDSVFTATSLDDTLAKAKRVDPDALKVRLRRRMGFVFDDDAESNGEGYDGTVQQALFLMNGGLVASGTSVLPSNTLSTLVESAADDDVVIDELYLRTLGRLPRDDERATAHGFLGAPRSFEKRDPPELPVGKKGGGKGKKKGAGADPLPARQLASRASTAKEQAFEDLFWALLNSSEFTFRR